MILRSRTTRAACLVQRMENCLAKAEISPLIVKAEGAGVVAVDGLIVQR